MADIDIPDPILRNERLEKVLVAAARTDTTSVAAVAEETGLSEVQLKVVLQKLEDLGLVRANHRASGGDLRVLDSGRSVAQDITASYRRGSLRDALIRRVVLEASTAASGALSCSLADAWSEPAIDPAPTADEFDTAASWLKDNSFLNAEGVLGGGQLLIGPTPKGSALLGSGKRLLDAEELSSVTNNYQSTSVHQDHSVIGGQAIGDSNTVTGTVFSGDVKAQVISHLDEAMGALPEAGAEEVRAEIDLARAMAESPSATPTMVHKLIERASMAAASTLGAAAAGTVIPALAAASNLLIG